MTICRPRRGIKFPISDAATPGDAPFTPKLHTQYLMKGILECHGLAAEPASEKVPSGADYREAEEGDIPSRGS